MSYHVGIIGNDKPNKEVKIVTTYQVMKNVLIQFYDVVNILRNNIIMQKKKNN